MFKIADLEDDVVDHDLVRGINDHQTPNTNPHTAGGDPPDFQRGEAFDRRRRRSEGAVQNDVVGHQSTRSTSPDRNAVLIDQWRVLGC